MSYRNLTPQAMVNISGPWLDATQDRKVFTALPLLAALLPTIEEAHEGIKTTQRKSSSIQQRVKALIDRCVALDARHDSKMRGTFNYLTALAEMTDDPELKDALLDLRDRLVPAGLKATLRSYTDEAGDAKLLPSRLDDASTKLLKKLKTTDGPLYGAVDAWIQAALELERVDAERARLAKELPADTDGVTSRDVLNAKNAWIRAVRAVESNLALEKGATPEIEDRLLSRLRREEAKADRRAASSAKTNGASEAPTGVVPPEAAPAVG
jgi:hypothetical protein